MKNLTTGHIIGATYFSRYWRETYTVLSANQHGFVTVEWHGDAQISNAHAAGHDMRRTTTHITGVGDDKLISCPHFVQNAVRVGFKLAWKCEDCDNIEVTTRDLREE